MLESHLSVIDVEAFQHPLKPSTMPCSNVPGIDVLRTTMSRRCLTYTLGGMTLPTAVCQYAPDCSIECSRFAGTTCPRSSNFSCKNVPLQQPSWHIVANTPSKRIAAAATVRTRHSNRRILERAKTSYRISCHSCHSLNTSIRRSPQLASPQTAPHLFA